jgi:DNA repair protein RecO (recombination protein O)
MVAAIGKPIADLPPASERALRQAERAVNETLEHHAHVHLRAVA